MDRFVAARLAGAGAARAPSIVMRGLDPRIHLAAVARSLSWIAGSSPRLSG
jgi:hypothetical protein